MLSVTIDIEDFANQVQGDLEQALDTALLALGEYAMVRMRQLSSEKLDAKAQKEYAESLRMDKEPDAVIVRLEGNNASWQEEGFASFDMKPGMLASDKAKFGKDGTPYFDVPFSHTTAKRDKSAQFIEPRSMREAVSKAQKSLEGDSSQRMFRGKKHRGTNYADMVVSAKSATTVRRVSKRSGDKWIHPGRKGIGVFKTVAAEIDNIKEQVIGDVIAGM